MLRTVDYLDAIGISPMSARTSAFDPGYDPNTLEGHLEQSSQLLSTLKLSMACWIIASEAATRRKVQAARRWHVRTVTGGGPYEIAVAQGRLESYLDLCADIGFSRIESGEGFTTPPMSPGLVIEMARHRGLEVQFELGKKHDGAFSPDVVEDLIVQGRRWLDAGAVELIVEARESAQDVGLFDAEGNFNASFADRLARAFTLDRIVFEAPNKSSQFAILEHFGREVRLANVRLEEILRVEIYRRGLHSDAFQNERLRPKRRSAVSCE